MLAAEEAECKTEEDTARAHGDRRQRDPRRGRIRPQPKGASGAGTSKPGIAFC